MSPRPPRSVTLPQCQKLSGRPKYGTCTACPTYWRLASRLLWPSLSSSYARPSPPQLSPLSRWAPSFRAFGDFCCSPSHCGLEFDDHVPHTLVFCDRSTSLGSSQSRSLPPLLRSSPETFLTHFCVFCSFTVSCDFCRWCDLVAFSPADHERNPDSFGLVGIGQPKTRRLVVHAHRQHVLLECAELPISFGACWKLFPPLPALSRSGPCFLNVTSRSSNRSSSGSAFKIGGLTRRPTWWGRNRFLATYPRHPRTSTTRTVVQRLQGRSVLLAHHLRASRHRRATGQTCGARARLAGQCASATAHPNTYFSSVGLKWC